MTTTRMMSVPADDRKQGGFCALARTHPLTMQVLELLCPDLHVYPMHVYRCGPDETAPGGMFILFQCVMMSQSPHDEGAAFKVGYELGSERHKEIHVAATVAQAVESKRHGGSLFSSLAAMAEDGESGPTLQ